MAKIETEGMVRLYVDLTVTLEEMKTWRPDRISAFFDGLAKIRTAVPESVRITPLADAVDPSVSADGAADSGTPTPRAKV